MILFLYLPLLPLYCLQIPRWFIPLVTISVSVQTIDNEYFLMGDDYSFHLRKRFFYFFLSVFYCVKYISIQYNTWYLLFSRLSPCLTLSGWGGGEGGHIWPRLVFFTPIFVVWEPIVWLYKSCNMNYLKLSFYEILTSCI